MIYALLYVVLFAAIGADWSRFFDYLKWSWTGGGEIPTIIQGISFFVAVLALVPAWFFFRRKKSEIRGKPVEAIRMGRF
jgi:hypothetical protein